MCDLFQHSWMEFDNKMWDIFVHVFLVHFIETISINTNSISVIRNVSLDVLDNNSTIINGTCRGCLCAVLLNITSSSSFNCFTNNNTRQMFSKSFETGSFTLVDTSTTSFYFFPFSTHETTSTPASTIQTTSISRSINSSHGRDTWFICTTRTLLKCSFILTFSNNYCSRDRQLRLCIEEKSWFIFQLMSI